MLEKIGHIKNPLSVIAIFAGLAEVSGTAILPLLEPETQSTYVWFLMLFPCVLVLLFFITLWCKHHVLYAPSDFKEDQSFTGLFMPSQISDERFLEALTPQIEIEPEPQDGLERNGDSESSVFTDSSLPDLADAAPPVGPYITNRAFTSTNQAPTESERALVRLARANYAEQRAIEKFGAEVNSVFMRDISPKSLPNIKFDAILDTSEHYYVVEVSYFSNKNINADRVAKKFDKVAFFWATLTEDERKKFKFVYICVFENADIYFEDKVACKIKNLAAAHPFITVVKTYDFNNLKRT